MEKGFNFVARVSGENWAE